MIHPRLEQLYRWSADELQLQLIHDGVPAYAWSPEDTLPWDTAPSLGARLVRRIVR